MKTILAGGGHGHVYVMSQMRKKQFPGKVLLLSDYKYQYYSGMLSDYISGNYSHEDVSFDLEELAKKTGIDYANEKILEIDNGRKVVITDQGQHNYDILSMDLGSKTYPLFHSLTVKPLTQLVDIKKMIENKEISSMVILGGGASGIELGLAYDLLGKKSLNPIKLTIIEKNKILKDWPKKARDLVTKEINNRGVNLIEGKSVIEKDGQMFLNDGSLLKTDLILQATGPRPNNIIYRGFSINEDGYLEVDRYLRAGDGAYAMGDMIHFIPKDLPKVGVYAIRQSPILASNLYASIEGKKIKEFKAQKHFLGLLSLGDKRAIAKWRGFTFYGKCMFNWKSIIDRKFMENNKA